MRRVIPQKTHVVLIIMCIGSPIALYVFIRVIMNNVDIRSDMDEGKYLIIEGPVENYKLSRGKGPYESFTVQGVEFRYSGSGLEEGYSVTATQGGAIYRNGQYVRIGYYSAGSPNAPFWDNNRILIMQVKNYLRTTD